MYHVIYNYVKACNGLNLYIYNQPYIYTEIQCTNSNEIMSCLLIYALEVHNDKNFRINNVILDKNNKSVFFYKDIDLDFQLDKTSPVRFYFDWLIEDEVGEKVWFEKALRVEVIDIENEHLTIAISTEGHFITNTVPIQVEQNILSEYHEYRYSATVIDNYKKVIIDLESKLKEYIVGKKEDFKYN